MTDLAERARAALDDLECRAENCVRALAQRGVLGEHAVLAEIGANAATIREALTAKAAPDQERAGWKLVPVEPTVEMIVCGWNDSLRVYSGAAASRACWASMLAAAPAPVVPEGEAVRLLRKLLAASEMMRHGGHRDSLVATYDGWANEARAYLAAAPKPEDT